MSNTNTAIEWTDTTWNPVTGCTPVSAGCDHCYAATIANRFAGTPAFPNGFRPTLRPERLAAPLRWRKPRRIFVNSMSDLFHQAVPEEYIAEIFAVMAAAHWHTFQILTKRHARMRFLLTDPDFRTLMRAESTTLAHEGIDTTTGNPWQHWPPPNVWLGVSVEDQHWADIRIPALLDTPAAVRFLSCEPLLGPIDLDRYLHPTPCPTGCGCRNHWQPDANEGGCPGPCTTDPAWPGNPALGWVIVGGESGPYHRHIDPFWVRDLRDQCTDSHVPFFFKQWGGRTPKTGGRLLDGHTWDQLPAHPTTSGVAA